jgi:hypothetical protein
VCNFLVVLRQRRDNEIIIKEHPASYEEEEREVGSSERHYGWGQQNIPSVLKVPRHCPFVLLVSVSF